MRAETDDPLLLTDEQIAFLETISKPGPMSSEVDRLLRYEQWKRVFRSCFPECSPKQYDLAMTAIAGRVGV